MKEIVFATNNAHKLDEMRVLLGGEYKVMGLRDIGCHDDIPETALTLEGNAEIKARLVKERYGYDCFADDTGLEVDALGGEPGVRSARYAGEPSNSEANVALLMERMAGKTNRKARFRTVIALMTGQEMTLLDGVVEGAIIAERRGSGGFGYDPVFVPEGGTLTFAEMSSEAKNAISHRGRAARRLLDHLSRL